MLRKLLATALLCFAGMVGNADAQSLNLIKVTSCGAGSYNVPYLTVDATGTLCTAASVSASISGFAPATTGTPISVTTGGVTGSLPAGEVVVATNVGTTNGAYCKLGASATTSDQYIAPNGGWFAFTVGANTQLTCITSTSTTTVNMVGGSGLPTGTGGGGGGGGSGGTSSAFDAAFPANGTAIGISDGTNMKAWLAAIALADGVNGNNTAAVAPWLWNGTTFDRARGDTTNGAWVNVKTSVLPTGAATAANQTAAAAAKGEGATGAAVPSGAQYMGINSGGNLTGWNGAVSQSGTWTVQPGNTANTTPWLTTINQGGNSATVKAGSSRPLASDPSLVVSLSPNVGGIAPVVSSALESNHVIKAGSGTLISAYVTTGAVAGYLLVSDSTTAPSAGGAAIAPIACVYAPANATTSIGGQGGPAIIASTGITLVFSTSGCLTNTASNTVFLSGQAL